VGDAAEKLYRDAQRQRRWLDHVLPDRLSGKTLTIVGLGTSGRHRAPSRAGLGCACRRHPPRPTHREAARVYRSARCARAWRGDSSWCPPLTRNARIIGADALGAMKPTAWLINIARGAVVDEAALLRAEQRRIAGRPRVFDREPLPPSHPLWKLDNVVVTPHISGPSTPTRSRRLQRQPRAFSRRGRPHVVDRSAATDDAVRRSDITIRSGAHALLDEERCDLRDIGRTGPTSCRSGTCARASRSGLTYGKSQKIRNLERDSARP